MTEDPARRATRLLRDAKTASLATLDADGHPLATLVAVATSESGMPLLLISRLARHTRNLAADPRASLLLRDEAAADPLAEARVTLVGTVAPTGDPSARARFLDRHPEAAAYADFSDFVFHAMTIERAHLVAGFGRIVEIGGADIMREASAR